MTGDEAVEALRQPWPWLLVAVAQAVVAVLAMVAGLWWLAASGSIGTVFALGLWRGARELAQLREAIAAEEARVGRLEATAEEAP